MSTVATHPALALRHAVDTITTELVRADLAPTYLSLTPHDGSRISVSLQFGSRADLDAAESLFGPALWHNAYEHDDKPRASFYVDSFMGFSISAGAPASDEIPADCESAAGTV